MDEDESDTTSCNEDPIGYDDYMQRTSEYGGDTIKSHKSTRSVDFAEQDLYNSLAKKYVHPIHLSHIGSIYSTMYSFKSITSNSRVDLEKLRVQIHSNLTKM